MSYFKFQQIEEIKLNDYLALERTRLANERTLFSYIRTALYLSLGGIAFLQVDNFKNIKWLAPIYFKHCHIGDWNCQIHIDEKKIKKVL